MRSFYLEKLCYPTRMRVLGIDVGARRMGLALSDDSGTLARPWRTIASAGNVEAWAREVAAMVRDLTQDPDTGPIGAIVVGLPRRLSGDDTHLTAAARAFARALTDQTHLAVHLQDERLSSREAESRLSLRERDWRKRKAKLDAAAAAVILQDFLDERARRLAQAETTREC
jgi:putative Holliday junction resolvase